MDAKREKRTDEKREKRTDEKRKKRTEKVQTHLTVSEKNAFLEVAEREGIPPAILLRKALNFFLDFSGYFTQSNSTKPEAGSKTKESFRFKKLPMFLCF